MKSNLKGLIILLITALIWGTTFIMQKKATGLVEAFTFNFFRSIIATILLFTIAFITRNKIEVKDTDDKGNAVSKKKVYIFSILAGIGMAGGATLQQIGLNSTDASTSAFLTSLYIVFAPILGLAFGKKVSFKIWICVFVALVGAYILAKGDGELLSFDLSLGSILIIISALFWALQICSIGMIASNINPFKLCGIELLITTLVSFIGMVASEEVVMENVWKAMPFILYAAVLSGTLSFAFQNIGQKYCEANLATLIMALEAVFAAISGVIFLHERLGLYGIIGSILIFSSVVIAQINFKKSEKENVY